jgi:DNA recombination protein RmuC
MDLVSLLFGLIGGLLGFGATYIFMMKKAQQIIIERETLQQGQIALSNQLEWEKSNSKVVSDQKLDLEREINALKEKLIVSESEKKNQDLRIQDQKKEIESMGIQLKEQFKNLANEILEEKSKKFTEQNKENINNILNPLSDKLKDFEKKVQETFEKEMNENGRLSKQIEHLTVLNHKMTEEANNLTSALKGSGKVQGDWGEIQLMSIFDISGLEKNINYTIQENIKSEDNKNMRPDAIVKLPDGKVVIVDSKVSLTSYLEFCKSQDPDLKKKFLSDHVRSIKSHVNGLSSKSYQKEVSETLDFVFMFVPIEAAFTLAMQTEGEIFQEAASKNIFIVTPTTLLASLRTVSFSWRQESQKQNVMEIVKTGTEIMDKFVSFADHFLDVENKIKSALTSHEQATKMFKGHGGISSKIEKLKNLGLKPTKKQSKPIELFLNPDSLEWNEDSSEQDA